MRIDSSAVIDNPSALTDASALEWTPNAPDDARSKSPTCTSSASDDDTDTDPLATLALSDENSDSVLALTSTDSVDSVIDSPAYDDSRLPPSTSTSDAATVKSLVTPTLADTAAPDKREPDDTDTSPTLSTDAEEAATLTAPPLNTSTESWPTTDADPDETSTALPPTTLTLSPDTRATSPAVTPKEPTADTLTLSDDAVSVSPDTISITRDDDARAALDPSSNELPSLTTCTPSAPITSTL
jgi:hypothetical protein